MKTKLVTKLFILFVGLVLFVTVKFFLQEGGLTGFFSSFEDQSKRLNWCADHVVDVVFVDTTVSDKLKALAPQRLREDFCELKIEDISGIDLDKVQWSPLAESAGAAGAKTVLEWNRELEVFRSGGLPFKSSALSLEILDR